MFVVQSIAAEPFSSDQIVKLSKIIIYCIMFCFCLVKFYIVLYCIAYHAFPPLTFVLVLAMLLCFIGLWLMIF